MDAMKTYYFLYTTILIIFLSARGFCEENTPADLPDNIDMPTELTTAKDNDSLFISAFYLYKQNKLDSAETQLLELVSARPDHYRAHLLLGNIFSRKDIADKAVFHYTRCIELNPDLAQAYVNLGLHYSKQDKLYKALEYLKEADRLDPYNFLTLFLIGDIYFRLGAYERAIKYFLDVRELNSTNVKNLLRLAECYQLKKEFEKEADIYKTILTFKKMVILYYRLGLAMNALGDTQGEINAYKEALELNPNEPDIIFNLGLAYYDTHQDELALQEFIKLTQPDHTDPDALYYMAKIYIDQGNKYKAWELYERLKTIDPEQADEIYNDIKH